jgi:competence protein ComEA
MDAPAPTPPAAPPPPQPPAAVTLPPQPPAVVTAWPRSAQLTTAFLLGVCLTLLAVHVLGALRFGTRPAELDRGPAYRIDLNQASRAELLQVPGIGPALAGRIEAYRQEHGAFQTVDELIEVRGIGPATLQRVRPWLCVDGTETVDEPATPPVRRSSRPAATPVAATMETERPKAPGKKETALASPLDINRASAEELQRISGVGPVLSQRIIDERNKRPFQSVNDLRRVPGIGPKMLERLRPNVTVGRSPPPLVEAERTVTADER